MRTHDRQVWVGSFFRFFTFPFVPFFSSGWPRTNSKYSAWESINRWVCPLLLLFLFFLLWKEKSVISRRSGGFLLGLQISSALFGHQQVFDHTPLLLLIPSFHSSHHDSTHQQHQHEHRLTRPTRGGVRGFKRRGLSRHHSSDRNRRDDDGSVRLRNVQDAGSVSRQDAAREDQQRRTVSIPHAAIHPSGGAGATREEA